MPQIIPPPPTTEEDFTASVWSQFFQAIRRMINQPVFYAATTDPGTANVPNGTWAIWKNTTTGVVKLWVNDGGVMKSVSIT